jgi:hypothetical protein
MRFFKSRIAAICCIGALAPMGCSFTASPAEGLQFQAPPGWQSSPGIMGFMQFWRSPSSDREILMLFKSPKPLATNEVFSNAQMQDSLKNVQIQSRRTIQICGNQPAAYVQARGSSAKGGDESVDMVMTTTHGTSYFAMYVRPIGAQPNPAAELALRELCPKS